jgi:hypothetical protein
MAACSPRQYNINVQICVECGGSIDVRLRKIHVEGKRWKGVVNKIIKKSYQGNGIYVCIRCVIPTTLRSYKSDVPDSVAM